MANYTYRREQNMRDSRLSIEGANIIFRNFSGRDGKCNKAGDRNFCVFIDDDELVEDLVSDGWNVRILAPRDDGDKARHYLPVAVSFKYRPPQVYLETRRKQTLLSEDMVSELDYADIVNADLTINPRIWGDDEERIKAYLKTAHFQIEEDEFADKYAREEAPED